MSLFAVCVCVCVCVFEMADTVCALVLVREQGLQRRRQSVGTDKGKPVCPFHCRPVENSPVSAVPRCLACTRRDSGGM